jgi:hypothetical protein
MTWPIDWRQWGAVIFVNRQKKGRQKMIFDGLLKN